MESLIRVSGFVCLQCLGMSIQLGSSLTDRLKEKELEFDTRFEECFGLGNKVFIILRSLSSSFYLLYFARKFHIFCSLYAIFLS